MGKKSRLKRLRREARNTETTALKLSAWQHPFAGIPLDKLAQGLAGFGREQAEAFAVSTTRIETLIADVSPKYLLSILAAYGLASFMAEDGSIRPKPKRSPEILPGHVELAQALCLKLANEQFAHNPALPEAVQAVIDVLMEWSEQFHKKRFVQLEQATSERDRVRLAIQEHMRLNTQTIRNWGYYDQVKRLAFELVAPLDLRFEQLHGFTATDVVLIFDHLFYESQRRLNLHWNRLRGMMIAPTLAKAVTAYYAEFPTLKGEPDKLIRVLQQKHATLQSAKTIMISHADLQLPDVYTVTADAIAETIHRPVEHIVRALNKLSHQFGDLRENDVEHFFMNNPVWTKPIIQLGNSVYFCIMPQLFFSYLFETLVTLVKENPKLLSAFDDRRSDYLEKKTAEIFRSGFPDAKIVQNFVWQTDDRSTQYESDLIVHIDSFLILIEAKSGRVDPAARRGAPGCLGENIDALLVEPARQSQRLAQTILAAKMGEAGTETFRARFPVNLSSVHRLLRISVTLDDIGFLQTRLTSLKKGGYVPDDVSAAPSVTLTDLEVVFDILRSPAERIHYWIRRNEWEGHMDYLADELDLLGVYLKTGLNVGDLESENVLLCLVGESKPIDDYYESRRHGVDRPAPTYQATTWWRDILARLADQKPPRWIEAAVVMLSAGVSEQQQLERKMKGVIADVARRRGAANTRNSLMFIPGKSRREAIAVVALMDLEIPDRHRAMENMGSQVFHEHLSVEQCVVIAINADNPHYPYSTLATFSR